MKPIFHLLPNAHLDPVWLWDWREGLNEGIATCRTMLRLLARYPEFTFIRGESSIYEHIERFDPESFAAIREYVRQGRWDIVGGNYVQTDTNMPATATLLKQYEYGRVYFRDKFDFDVEVAWAPDSFGHSAGFPEIYTAAGFRYFAFTRRVSELPEGVKPLFYWSGPGGSRILTVTDKVAWYGCSRDEMPGRLDTALALAPEWPVRHIPIFFGLGNHGGGTSQRHLDDIFRWRDAHPEVEVRFSTLTGFFHACEAERRDYPEYRGEINFCLRGCTISAARVKGKFRQTEAAVRRAEFVTRTVAHGLGTAAEPLTGEWRGLLFNSFHDILPGTSIDRANDEQIEWMDQVIHQARTREFHALNELARRLHIGVKTPEYDMPEAVPMVIFNPRPTAYRGPVELEFCMDYRPNTEYLGRDAEMPVEVLDEDGNSLPFQAVATEHSIIPGWPWRRRLVLELDLPAGGFRQLSAGHVKAFSAPAVEDSGVTAGANFIANEFFRVEANPGETRLRIFRDGKPVLAQEGLEFAVYQDRFGSWGAMDEAPEGWRCDKRLQTWVIREVKVLENGPLRAAMFVHFEGGTSQVRLQIRLYRGSDRVECLAQAIWQERAARLRLVMDPAAAVRYAIPGGSIVRSVLGDVPGGRWLELSGCGIVSDAFCGFTMLEREFGINLIRGCRSASDEVGVDARCHERPITDYGEHRFHFGIVGETLAAAEQAERMELPPVTVMSYPHDGSVTPSRQSWFAVEPDTVRLLDYSHIQLQQDTPAAAVLRLAGRERRIALEPWKIYDIADFSE